MDSKTFEEIITCGICFELFNEDDRCPRMSLCGHTFCHSCLEKILKQNPLCPTCKVKIQSQKAELIPTNFTVKSMISVVKQEYTNESQDNSLEVKTINSLLLKSEGFCTEHSSKNELRCMDCESWICAMCGVMFHKKCRILLVDEAYEEMKIQVNQKIERELELRKAMNDSVCQSLKTLNDEKKELNNKKRKIVEFDLKICEKRIEELSSLKSEDDKFCETLHCQVQNMAGSLEFSIALGKLEDLIVKGTMLSSYVETLYDNWPWQIPNTIEELRNLCNEVSVYAVVNDKDNLYGMVKVKNGQIWISSFQSKMPEGHFIEFNNLLSRYRESAVSHVPKKGFLKLAPTQVADEAIDLVIETDGTSPRSKNFIALCSALKGQMYKGRTLKYTDSLFYELKSGPPPVVKGIITKKGSCTTWKEGFVVGMWEGNSGFYIALEGDDSEYSLAKFGVVVSGLRKLKALRSKKLIIKESGLVI